MPAAPASPASPTSTPATAPRHAAGADRSVPADARATGAVSAPSSAAGPAAPSAAAATALSARVGGLAPSATLAVDAKAKALRARGVDVVGFGAGEPDFPTPAAIVEAAVAACRDPRMHRYTPTAGLPELRAAIAAKTARDSGLAVDPSQVLVTNGGKHAVANAFATLLGPGDEALLPAPYWTSYPELVRLAGARPVPVLAGEERGFKVGVEELEAARTPRTKLVVFVSPSNPTGAVYTEAEIAAIGAWAVEHGIWVVTDEIYEHLVYGSASFHSLPVVVPEAVPRCVVLNGVAKTYAMTGWRVGWMIGPEEVVAAATNLQSQETSNVGNVSQAAALAAVSGDLEAVATMRAAFDRRRRAMYTHLAAMPGVTCLEPGGAFYAFPRLEGLLGRPLDGPGGRVATTTAELAELALEEARVAFVPGEAFGAPGYGRFSYALADEDLEEGMRRFAALAGRLAS